MIDGDGLLAMDDAGVPVVFKTPVVVRAGRTNITVNGSDYRRLTFAGVSKVQINSRPYRGRVEVSLQDGALLVVNELLLEEYLAGLINSEISSAWPIEAVKAQAVIARTYALNRKSARSGALYHLESSVMDQVYDGADGEDPRAVRGVEETAGEVLTYQGTVIQAFYHSSCGGKTESAENVWGTAIPYLSGVECRYCLEDHPPAWEQKLTLAELEKRLKSAGFKVDGLKSMRPGPLNNRGRLKSVIAVTAGGDVVVPGDQFRRAIGYGIIKSTQFTFTVDNGAVSFTGSGNGHGVGLCQWGAKQRALAGFSYREILSYYYPGTELKKLFDIR